MHALGAVALEKLWERIKSLVGIEVESSLTEAKESGEFDGETPVKGVDYFTEADIQECAEAAAELVDFSDKVVSWGRDANWMWRKWESGWAEADYLSDLREFTTDEGNQGENLYYRDLGSVTYPFAFVSEPRATASYTPVDPRSTGFVMLRGVGTTSVLRTFVMRGTPDTTLGRLCIKLSGFWK